MPNIDLSILNQRQTPAFYADTLANRPAAGFVGRIFVSTDTFAFYRDNGTTWDLIGGPGTGTVTGTGTNGQVTYWNGASTITGSNDLFFDAVNGHLGIGTITPGTALGIDHDQSTLIQLQQTVATNDNRIAFLNNGVGLWRIGSFYNAGANDFGIFDVVGSAQPVTVKKTTGQVLIGTSTVGSGKLVVASSTGDNHIQIVGATSPSLRIDSAESGPTKRIGLGLATAVNNFIQNSQNLDMCIFNGSTSAAGNMLFGIYDTGLANVQEAARISAARNFLIGTTTDAGQKLQVTGTSYLSGNVNIGATSFTSPSGADTILGVYGGQDCSLILQDAVQLWEVYVNDDFYINRGSTNNFILNRTTGATKISATTTNGLTIETNDVATLRFTNTGGVTKFWGFASTLSAASDFGIYQSNSVGGDPISAGTARLYFSGSGNVLIGTTTDAGQKLQVNGTTKSNKFLGATNVISNANSPFASELVGGIIYFEGILTNGQQFGSTGGTYIAATYFISYVDNVTSQRGSAMYMIGNPVVNGGTNLISQSGPLTFSAVFNLAATISLAMDASGRGPILTNNTTNSITFYCFVLGGA